VKRTTNTGVVAFLCAAATAVWADSKEDVALAEAQRVELLNRIETMKSVHGRLQERYRETIEKRWRQQQEHLRVREDYKMSADGLRQRQEILYNELSRAREEALVRENALREKEEILKEKSELAEFLGKQVRDKIADAAKSVREGFPTNMEERVGQLGGIDAATSTAGGLKGLLDRRLDWLTEDAGISIGPHTVLPGRGDPLSAEVLKIGNCFAYAVAPSGEAYLLSAGAKNRQYRFEWKPIKSHSVGAPLASNFPAWLSNRRLSGVLPVDILQSSLSEQLFENRQPGFGDRFFEYVKAGGPNIVVLWVVGFAALLIVLERWFVLLRRGTDARAFADRLLSLAHDGKTELAETMLRKSSSALARCLRLLWRERGASRRAAEKTLKEAFLKELPPLERRLSLLAALAAAAPLLGLLGTVGGLITLFQVLNTAGTNDTKVLAGGISEALVNTLNGLAIAIPALLLHGYLSERAAFIQNSVQAASAEVLNALWPVEDRGTMSEKASYE
jgi:biopolymer transport protein ExbB